MVIVRLVRLHLLAAVCGVALGLAARFAPLLERRF